MCKSTDSDIEFMRDEFENKNSSQNAWLKPALFFYGKATGWIVGSALIAVIFGKYIVSVTGKDYWIIIFIILGFVLAIYGIFKEIKTYKKDIEQDIKNGDRK